MSMEERESTAKTIHSLVDCIIKPYLTAEMLRLPNELLRMRAI